MALDRQTQKLVDAAEAALLNARIELSNFQAAATRTPQRIDHDRLLNITQRSQSMPWSLTSEEKQILETAQRPTMPGYSETMYGRELTPAMKAAAQRSFSEFADEREARAAKQQPVVRDRRYYRRLWTGGDVSRAECMAYASTQGMSRREFVRWLWADEKPQPSSGQPLAHQAWAKKILANGAA